MLTNYNLIVDNVEVVDLDVNHSFTFLSVGKGTFADNIEITNSHFKNITGYILALAEESDDDGIYNAEYVTIKNSTFENVQGAVLNFYRGGRDESTFGPHLDMSGNLLSNVGNGNRNKAKAAVRLQGVQVTSIKDNEFKNTPAINIIHQLMGGIRSSMGYTGNATLAEMRENCTFVRITNAGVRESHVHDVTITKEAPNYRS